MSLFEIVSALLALTAALAYVNERRLHLPGPIGVTLGGLLTSLALLLVGFLAPERRWLTGVLGHVDFENLLLNGFLGVLLFAGSLHLELDELLPVRTPVAVLALAGTTISTVVVGTVTWGLLRLVGLGFPYLWALLFGALISPTDPIAVMGLLSEAGAPSELTALITGESLFNDGVAVVFFTIVLGLVTGQSHASFLEAGRLFLVEAGGGIAYGFAIGWIADRLLGRVDEAITEILITVAIPTAGYVLANRLGASGPLAMVVAGLLVGSRSRARAMSQATRERLDIFWMVVDQILNAVLFVLIGLGVLVLPIQASWVGVGAVMIPVLLGARLVSVFVPVRLMSLRRRFPPYTVRVLTWGGLRGGIAIALALSLPAGTERSPLLLITYIVVVFSILVQGLTMKRLASRAAEAEAAAAA